MGRKCGIKKIMTPYLFLAPAFLVFTVFVVYPIFLSFFFSVTNWDGLSQHYKIIGFDNFIYLFGKDRLAWMALKNNVFFIIFGIVGDAAALLFALLLDMNLKGKEIYRTVIFTPVVISYVAVGYIWSFIYSPNGILNGVLMKLKLVDSGISWLGEPALAIYAVIAVEMWKSAGYYMVIFLAGLQNIPVELTEAAVIDGANWRDRLAYIVLPLLKPATVIVLILTVIGELKVFDLPFVMTGGGPANSTETFAVRLLYEGFQSNRMGYASAISIVLFLIIITVSLVQLKIAERKDDTVG